MIEWIDVKENKPPVEETILMHFIEECVNTDYNTGETLDRYTEDTVEIGYITKEGKVFVRYDQDGYFKYDDITSWAEINYPYE